jgi:hypothetical protein
MLITLYLGYVIMYDIYIYYVYLDVGAQVPPVEALHDQVHALGGLYGLVHAGDAGVAVCLCV